MEGESFIGRNPLRYYNHSLTTQKMSSFTDQLYGSSSISFWREFEKESFPSIDFLIDTSNPPSQRKIKQTKTFPVILETLHIPPIRSKSCFFETEQIAFKTRKLAIAYEARRVKTKKRPDLLSLPCSSGDQNGDSMESIPSIRSIEKASAKIEELKEKQAQFKNFKFLPEKGALNSKAKCLA